MSAPAPRVPRAARALLVAAGPLASVALALGAGALFILAIGEHPLQIYGLLFRESLGTGYGLGQSLFKATPLIFTGLAVALGFRAGLFNIGAEGQITLGGFAAALVGAGLARWPAPLLLPLCLLAAALAGGLWGGIPGALKARLGSHEVINTIMLNFIAFALVSWWGHRVFQPATVHTAPIGAGAHLTRLDALAPALRGSPANFALALGLIAALAVGAFLFRTRRGYELRAVGLAPGAAEYGGISIGARQALALALSGALAGLGGVNFVNGYKHFFEQGFAGGAGFIGIAVALLGRNHPIGVVAAALFLGVLGYGGLVINARVPKELVEILQALVILIAIVVQQVIDRVLRRLP